MTVARRLSIATVGFRGGGGAGTTILVNSVDVSLTDQDMGVELVSDMSVSLTDSALSVELAAPSFSVTLDTGFSVSLEPDLEIELG